VAPARRVGVRLIGDDAGGDALHVVRWEREGGGEDDHVVESVGDAIQEPEHVGDGVGPSGADVEQPVPAGLAVGEEEPGAVARAEVARAGELAVVAAAAEVAVDARRVGGREEERQDPGRSIHGCRHEHHEPRVAGDGHVDAVDCAGYAAMLPGYADTDTGITPIRHFLKNKDTEIKIKIRGYANIYKKANKSFRN